MIERSSEAVRAKVAEAIAALNEAAAQLDNPTPAKPKQSRFKRCLEFTLKWEGGYVDHPDDPGGATNKGITLATYQDWEEKPVTKAMLREISDKIVRAIYKERYWDKIRGDDLPNGVDLAVFDMAVHSGPARSVMLLQQIVGVSDDGIMGPVTLEAVACSNPYAPVARQHINRRWAFLKRLKHWPTFRTGWTNRMDDLSAATQGERKA